MTTTHRAYFANVPTPVLARVGQEMGLSGTVIPGCTGFGAWGIEPSVIVELSGCDRDDMDRYVRAILLATGEEAAWVTSQSVDAAGLVGAA